jgi:iron complex transport system permease protein
MTDHLRTRGFGLKLALGALALIAAFFAAMTLGAAKTTVGDLWLALTGAEGEKLTILREIRLPRVVAAVFVGAALSVAGAVMQGMTRNPLADPGLLGLTAGASAALAAAMALIPGLSTFGIVLVCFAGAAAGTFLVFGISSMKRGGFSPFRLVLTGAAVSTFLFAVTDGMKLYFKIAKEVTMWTSGGLNGTNWHHVQVIAPFIAVGLAAAIAMSRQVTILSLSEEVAVGLGQNVNRIKRLLLFVVILLAGASVALVGNLVFVGLIVPHLVRGFVGTDYRYVVPMSALFGGAFMVLADLAARTVSAPYETPLVAIAAMIGLPMFLWIVRKGGRAFT